MKTLEGLNNRLASSTRARARRHGIHAHLLKPFPCDRRFMIRLHRQKAYGQLLAKYGMEERLLLLDPSEYLVENLIPIRLSMSNENYCGFFRWPAFQQVRVWHSIQPLLQRCLSGEHHLNWSPARSLQRQLWNSRNRKSQKANSAFRAEISSL